VIGPGSKLAHYEVVSALGKGGMGEVWRAKDTKLGREVAIKTLPAEFAQDTDRLARFEREAKLLASLNHPNIAAIHGFEEDNGTHFLVMELVEGDTLADRVGRGAIPVEESLKLALQIADALKAAHEKGVIHRDLKPANIKVTDDNSVKVLDFGLAKAVAGEEVEQNPSNSPTLSMQATQQGMILGTAAYMSPEQAKGRAVDKRADVWAFGCVLYEMLTGRQSFGKPDVTESLAAVISLPPEWSTLPVNLHPRLREAVERCLEKPLAKRYQDIGDVKIDIEKVLADPGGVIVQPVAAPVQAAPPSRLGWVAAAVFAVAAIVIGIGSWQRSGSEDRPLVRLNVDLGPGVRLARNDSLPCSNISRRDTPGLCSQRSGQSPAAFHTSARSSRGHRTSGHRWCQEPVLFHRRSVAGFSCRQCGEKDLGRGWYPTDGC
jgi:serine/threonine protein kinase